MTRKRNLKAGILATTTKRHNKRHEKKVNEEENIYLFYS